MTTATTTRLPTQADFRRIVAEEFNHTGSNVDKAVAWMQDTFADCMANERDMGETDEACAARVLASDPLPWCFEFYGGVLCLSKEVLDDECPVCSGCNYRVCTSVRSHEVDGEFVCSQDKGITEARFNRG